MKQKKKWVAVLLALFLGIFSFIYTWKYDKKKFWILLGVLILLEIITWIVGLTYKTISYLSIIPNGYALIVQFVIRDSKWFENYYKK